LLATASPLSAGFADLLPAERPAVSDSVPLRQEQFATGRACARRLLDRLAGTERALPSGHDRAPVWPRGFLGSISHASDLCVAAVARLSDVSGVGIDVEVNEGIESDLWDLICTAPEQTWLYGQPPRLRAGFVRALFSAKECTYKCLSPKRRVAFEPRDLDIHLDLARGKFQARLPNERAAFPSPLVGSIAKRGRWVLTRMTIGAVRDHE
jgi:4'-phosphopantetheinyl transferase EntD